MSTSNMSSVTPHGVILMQPPHAIFTLHQFMQITGQQFINPSANSPRLSTSLPSPPPPYSECRLEQTEGVNDSRRRHDPFRWTLVLHSYLVIVILLLATLTLVNLYKLLPPPLSNFIHGQQHWIYPTSALVMASSLIMLTIRQTSGSLLNKFWIILLWGSSTVNVITMERQYTLTAVYMAGCLTLVATMSLSLFALWLKADLTKKCSALMVLLCGVAVFIMIMSILRGWQGTRTGASAAWIAASTFILPFLTQFIVGGRNRELPKEDFILAKAILYTLTVNAFQHILFFSN